MSVSIRSEYFQRGIAALRAGDYQEASGLFREDEERAGTVAATYALLQKAEARLAAGALDEAAALFDQVVDRNPSIVEAYLGLARLGLATGALEAARVHATAATRVGAHQGRAWTVLGLVHRAEGDLPGALAPLRKGAELAPDAFLSRLELGRALLDLGEPREALLSLLAATGLEPGNPEGFALLAKAHLAAGQRPEATWAARKVTEVAPGSVQAWTELADLAFEARDLEQARAVLDRGLQACGDQPALLEKAVATAMLRSDAPAAVAYLKRELEVVPDHQQGWLNLAALSLTTGAFDQAEAAARTLLEKHPDNWEGWFLLGNLYGSLPLPEKAEDAYRQAIRCAPGNWKPLMNLATLCIESKDPARYAEAVSLLNEALAVAPRGEWRLQYNLALAQVRLGQREPALALARGILRDAPAEDPVVAEAQKLEANLLEQAR